jgi:acylphosphatase
MNKRVHLIISGKVQGVWFRLNTKNKADELGIFGWVKNTLNDKVEIIIEGNETNIKKMIKWCYKGSPLSKVENVDIDYQKPLNKYNSFNIRY